MLKMNTKLSVLSAIIVFASLLCCRSEKFENNLAQKIHQNGLDKPKYTVFKQGIAVDFDNQIRSWVGMFHSMVYQLHRMAIVKKLEDTILKRLRRRVNDTFPVTTLQKIQNNNSSSANKTTVSDIRSTSQTLPLKNNSTNYLGSTSTLKNSVTTENVTTIFSTTLPIKMNQSYQRINWTGDNNNLSPTKNMTLSNNSSIIATLPFQKNYSSNYSSSINIPTNSVTSKTATTIISTTLPIKINQNDQSINNTDKKSSKYVMNKMANEKSSTTPGKTGSMGVYFVLTIFTVIVVLGLNFMYRRLLTRSHRPCNEDAIIHV